MKKYILIVSISIFILGILTSCSTSEKAVDFQNMDSKTFLETVSLLEKLSIDINLDDIKSVEAAKTYKAEHIVFDNQKLIDAFMKSSVTEEKIWAEGPQFIASAGNTQEFLSIYDGGKSFGIKTSLKGGFRYSRIVNGEINKLSTVANCDFYYPSFSKSDYNSNDDYSSYTDLNFLSYEDALTDIKRIINAAKIPQFDVHETYSLDLKTIKSHYELYLKSASVEEELKNLDWTKEDECYIFSLRQLVDNIPIINREWYMPDGTKSSAFGNFMPATYINLVYDSKGIKEINAKSILNVIDEIEINRLINVYEALNTLIEDYSLTILENDVSIVSAELCYLSIPKGDVFELIPGWVFCSTQTIEFNGELHTQYKYDVVNAVTGKLYQSRW
ncbi:MAG TPA: hypothetical protein PLH43_05820 [Acetivibrio sp.]|uniref:hypothetical protein n=1 Tax=Acetivibrio sp. TaxID=1872092 RepID=UPI002B5F3A1E|nr:hypothetical protein [Acetivibrio sp.]HOM02329.1 hypothetical protein [Acetivibrio sp.]